MPKILFGSEIYCAISNGTANCFSQPTMLEKRNLSSHTYDEETAKEIYRNVAEKYIFLFEEFASAIDKKLCD